MSGMFVLSVRGKGTGLFSMWTHLRGSVSQLKLLLFGKAVPICGVGVGHDYRKSFIYFLGLCLRAVRFLAPQESLNQAIEEGPLVLQLYSSERHEASQ